MNLGDRVQLAKQKIQTKLDHLQLCMEGQAHLDRPEYVDDVIASIIKCWSVLDQDDREYVDAAKYAVLNKMQWNV